MPQTAQEPDDDQRRDEDRRRTEVRKKDLERVWMQKSKVFFYTTKSDIESMARARVSRTKEDIQAALAHQEEYHPEKAKVFRRLQMKYSYNAEFTPGAAGATAAQQLSVSPLKREVKYASHQHRLTEASPMAKKPQNLLFRKRQSGASTQSFAHELSQQQLTVDHATIATLPAEEPAKEQQRELRKARKKMYLPLKYSTQQILEQGQSSKKHSFKYKVSKRNVTPSQLSDSQRLSSQFYLRTGPSQHSLHKSAATIVL